MPAEKSAATRALGHTIRSARSERGYAQETSAAHVGLDRSYYGAIERGEFNLTLATLLKIAGRPRYAR
jgi:transcriptional regulator with XRE-family HTH domain